MAARVGQRVVGSVLARLVSVVAGGIGIVLIAKDIWDLRNGVLPIVATEMKSKENKDKVQEELAKTFAEQISGHIQEIGAATADRVIDIWREFRSAHAEALGLAERNPKFKAFVDSLQPAALPRLDEVVALLLAGEGESGILRRLDDGTLSTAINKLPAPAMDIARETRSVDAGIKWAALAGDSLPKVVELSLYRRTQPDQLSRASLQRLLALEDQLAIVRLASIDRAARDTLFELNDTDLKNLARSLTEDELSSLSRYLTGLQKEPRERVLRAVAANPAQIHSLSSERVRQAVVASTDQSAAVSMMLRSGGGARSRRDRQRCTPRRRRPRQPDPAVGKAPHGDRRARSHRASRAAAVAPAAVHAPADQGRRLSQAAIPQPSPVHPGIRVPDRVAPAISRRGPAESASAQGSALRGVKRIAWR